MCLPYSSRLLRTLHLTNCWHATSGGIATFYRALLKTAEGAGHEIRLVVPGERDAVEPVGCSGKIYYLRSPLAPFNSRYRIIYPPQFLAPGGRLQKILLSERPHIVEVCDKYTLNYLGPLLRRRLLRGLDFRPVVVGLTCERMDDNVRAYIGAGPGWRAFCAQYMKWLYFPFFDCHIANSEYTADELRDASRARGLSRHIEIFVRPMGVDLHYFSPSRKSAAARQLLLRRCGGGDESVLLIYSGRLVPEKNLPLLFEVFARLAGSGGRDYRLLIAGDGIERPRWESFCASHVPGRVAFLGHLQDPGELAGHLANADAFVHPNHREPFGIAPLEAMASGLPLVAPDRGGVSTYAHSENAWTAAPDPESFVSAIHALLDDADETARRARNALHMAAEFRWEKVAAGFLDLYAELHRLAMAEGTEVGSPRDESAIALSASRGFSKSA